MAQWLTNPTRNHEVSSSIPGLAQWIKGSGIAVSCGVGCRRGSDPALLWPWRRPVATAPIQPLAQGSSACCRCDPKKQKTITTTKFLNK